MEKKLMRSRDNRWVSGVLGGFGAYFGVEPVILRLVYAVVTLLTGVFPGIGLYLIAIALMPEEPRTKPHVRLTDADFYT